MTLYCMRTSLKCCRRHAASLSLITECQEFLSFQIKKAAASLGGADERDTVLSGEADRAGQMPGADLGSGRFCSKIQAIERADIVSTHCACSAWCMQQ